MAAPQVLGRLADLLTYPPRDRMPCLLLFGPTGMGKTRIVQDFLREYRPSFDGRSGCTRLPVASIQMPPAPANGICMKQLLFSFVSCDGILWRSKPR
jgi:hypothetical protein